MGTAIPGNLSAEKLGGGDFHAVELSVDVMPSCDDGGLQGDPCEQPLAMSVGERRRCPL